MASEKSIETRVALLEKLVGRVFIELESLRGEQRADDGNSCGSFQTFQVSNLGRDLRVKFVVMQEGMFERGETTVSAPPAQTESVVDWHDVAKVLALEVAEVTGSCPADSKDTWESVGAGPLSHTDCDKFCSFRTDCTEYCWLEWAIQEVERSCQSSE